MSYRHEKDGKLHSEARAELEQATVNLCRMITAYEATRNEGMVKYYKQKLKIANYLLSILEKVYCGPFP